MHLLLSLNPPCPQIQRFRQQLDGLSSFIHSCVCWCWRLNSGLVSAQRVLCPSCPCGPLLLVFILPASFRFPEQSASIVSLRKSCGNFPTEHKSKNLCKVIWETSALRPPARGVWLRLRAWKPGVELHVECDQLALQQSKSAWAPLRGPPLPPPSLPGFP